MNKKKRERPLARRERQMARTERQGNQSSPPPNGTLAAFRQEITSGPIPAPEVLARYGEIDSGLPSRIIDMAVVQAEHRQRLESSVIENDIFLSRRGQTFGFYLGLAGILVSGIVCSISSFIGSTSGNVSGGVIGGTSLVALVTVFVQGSKNRSQERLQKRSRMNNPEN